MLIFVIINKLSWVLKQARVAQFVARRLAIPEIPVLTLPGQMVFTNCLKIDCETMHITLSQHQWMFFICGFEYMTMETKLGQFRVIL